MKPDSWYIKTIFEHFITVEGESDVVSYAVLYIIFSNRDIVRQDVW